MRLEVVDEVVLPDQAVVREQECLVEAETVELGEARRRLPVRGRERLVVGPLGRLPRERSLEPGADLVGLARHGHVGEHHAPAVPFEPRVPGRVVDDLQRLVAAVRVGVVGPQRPRLEQVLVAVDDPRRAHAAAGYLSRPGADTGVSSLRETAIVDVLHGLTFADVLREQRRSRPEQLAVVDGDFGRDVRLTYPELDDRTNQLANALAAAGVGHGDRILWLGQNSFRVVEAPGGGGEARGDVLPRELAAERRRAGVRRSTTSTPRSSSGRTRRSATRCAAARELAGSTALWLRHDADGDGSYEAFLTGASNADPAVDVDPSAALLLIYTAAFSGRPNGAMLSHTALITQGLVMGRLSDIDADYVYLNCGPLFHIATFMTTLATYVAAGTNVFTRRVDAEELCRLIESERCTGAFVVGPTIEQILEANKDHRYDLKSLRAFRGKPEWNEMITVDTSPWARHPGGYGQTEVMGMLTFNTLARSPHRHARTPVPRRPSPDRRSRRPRGPRRRDRRDRRPRADRDERLLEPARGERSPPARRLAPHERPRPPRSRRDDHVHRAGDAHDQVGRREHLPRRGRGMRRQAPGRRRVRRHRRSRRASGRRA